MRAQQGKLLKAEAFWTRVSSLDPSNEDYRSGLRRIAQLQRRPVWAWFLWPWLVVVAFIACVAISGSSVIKAFDRLGKTVVSTRKGSGTGEDKAVARLATLEESQEAFSSAVLTMVSQLRNLEESQRVLSEKFQPTTSDLARIEKSQQIVFDLLKSLSSDLTAIRRSHQEQRDMLTSATRVLAGLRRSNSPKQTDTPSLRLSALDLKTPGVLVKSEGSEIVVTFNHGLFSWGTVLTTEAKVALTALGQRLGPERDNIRLHVTGCTDNTPVPEGRAYQDNVALGIARAVTVVEHLRATTALTCGMFTISSRGESTVPFPHDTAKNRARNRTVIIRISNAKATSGI
jgi:flagellar motor protein MotB